MIDNYDSFTYNIVQYCKELGADLRVIRNDEMTVEEIRGLAPEKIYFYQCKRYGKLEFV